MSVFLILFFGLLFNLWVPFLVILLMLSWLVRVVSLIRPLFNW